MLTVDCYSLDQTQEIHRQRRLHKYYMIHCSIKSGQPPVNAGMTARPVMTNCQLVTGSQVLPAHPLLRPHYGHTTATFWPHSGHTLATLRPVFF